MMAAGWALLRRGVVGVWNGACLDCHKPAEQGDRLTWDPNSGRPSKWRHIDCSNPQAPIPAAPRSSRVAPGQGSLLDA